MPIKSRWHFQIRKPCAPQALAIALWVHWFQFRDFRVIADDVVARLQNGVNP